MKDNPYEIWARECELARRAVEDWPRFEEVGEVAIEAAERLLAIAKNIKGVACPKCQGFGARTYGDTSTWRGGAGGQAMTSGVCDKCWGTGRTDQKGPDRRRIAEIMEREKVQG